MKDVIFHQVYQFTQNDGSQPSLREGRLLFSQNDIPKGIFIIPVWFSFELEFFWKIAKGEKKWYPHYPTQGQLKNNFCLLKGSIFMTFIQQLSIKCFLDRGGLDVGLRESWNKSFVCKVLESGNLNPLKMSGWSAFEKKRFSFWKDQTWQKKKFSRNLFLEFHQKTVVRNSPKIFFCFNKQNFFKKKFDEKKNFPKKSWNERWIKTFFLKIRKIFTQNTLQSNVHFWKMLLVKTSTFLKRLKKHCLECDGGLISKKEGIQKKSSNIFMKWISKFLLEN